MVPEIQMDKHQVIINPLDHAEDIAKLSISEEEDTFEGLFCMEERVCYIEQLIG